MTERVAQIEFGKPVPTPVLPRRLLWCGELPSGGAAGDAVGEVGGVLADEAEQVRAAAVLPGQAEEVQAGDLAAADHYHTQEVFAGPASACQIPLRA